MFLYHDPISGKRRSQEIMTTRKTGGLHNPYKGMLLASA